MKKLYCAICAMYRKFEKPKISYLLEKKHFKEVFKEEQSVEILKILGLI